VKLSTGLLMNSKSFTVFENPTVENAQNIIEEAILRRKALIIVGNCWINYQGRASSKLEPGERIVILKQDGSLLVHRPVGYEPVNWQPPGCTFSSTVGRGLLSLRAAREKPREVLRIHFDRLFLISVLSLVDEGRFSLYASEEDMQKAILVQPSLVEKDLKLITYEKKVEPGFIDVYGIDDRGRMVIIEIKRKTAGKEAALQLARYVESVKESTNREVRGILVAPSIAKGVQRLLAALQLDFKALDPRKCAETIRSSETKRLQDFLQVNKKETIY